MTLSIDEARLYSYKESPEWNNSLFLYRDNKLERSPIRDTFEFSNPLKYRNDAIKGSVSDCAFELTRKYKMVGPVHYSGYINDKPVAFRYMDGVGFFNPDLMEGNIEGNVFGFAIKKNWKNEFVVNGGYNGERIQLVIAKNSKGKYTIKTPTHELQVTDKMLNSPMEVEDIGINSEILPLMFSYIKEKIDAQKDDIIIQKNINAQKRARLI